MKGGLTRNSKWRQGQFVPRHPEKYIGNPNNILYRSSWELKFFEFLDNNTKVLRWCSEEIAIKYWHPVKKRISKYYVDCLVEYIDRDGKVKRELIEIKPAKQTRKSTAKNPKTKLYEDVTLAVNTAKWMAATKYCQQRGIEFRILTEKQLFI